MYSIEQQIAFNKYIEGKNIFITGPGGSGKSKLIRDIRIDAIQKNKKIQICALTGCAAVLLNCRAKTIHSWSGIGLGNGSPQSILEKIKTNHYKRHNWKTLDILVIDEVSMMSKKIIELLDIIGKGIRHNNKPFGGIQVIFSGDFYQLPTVGNKEEPDTTKFCFESELWFALFLKENNIQLKTIFRQQDAIYANILNQIREGKLRKSSCKLLEKYINRPKPIDFTPTKLFPTRYKADYINQEEMMKLEEEEECECHLQPQINLPMSEKEKHERQNISKEIIETELNYIQGNLMCETILKLKKGAQVMCIVNIELPNGTILCNGSQGKIIAIKDNIPVVRFNINNNMVEIPMVPHIWPSENIPGIGVSQIPLILAWALTIHKSQGATLDCAEIDIGNSIFECGQTYVALSRVKDLEGLYLTSFEPTKIRINKKVREFYDALNKVEE